MKNKLSAILRKTGLLYAADYVKYLSQKIQFYSSNKRFQKTHPGFSLPPDYFLYETFLLHYADYYSQGKWNAAELVKTIQPLTDLGNPGKKILDWGCGPARVLRFFPELLPAKHLLFGTDYNRDYIDWCSKNLPGINFSTNELNPPLQFESNYFDVIYSISILTHLSQKNHRDWINEIHRVLKPGGILIISTQGSAFKNKMLKQELLKFESGELVVRIAIKEGHRIFSAFQPENFMINLFKDFEIIAFQAGTSGLSIHGLQDTWIVKKKN
jgi:SAM-dependent methyltransferase